MEFRDPKIERLAGLTAADRKWMDEIVKDVNDAFSEDPNVSINAGMQLVSSISQIEPALTRLCEASRVVTTICARNSRSIFLEHYRQ